MNAARWLVATSLLVGIAAFFALDGQRFLNLAWLQASQTELTELYKARPVEARASFFLLYLAVASMSVPGIVVLTLAGGAVLGFWWGLLLVSFASSMGATVSFLCARFLLRDAIETRFAKQLNNIHDGLQRDGAFYLFSLRLIPVAPFFMVNVAMGLTPLRTWTFYWVSQLGMLASTALYVNAGTQLANVNSVEDIASAELLVALSLIGLLPLAARLGLKFWQRHVRGKTPGA